MLKTFDDPINIQHEVPGTGTGNVFGRRKKTRVGYIQVYLPLHSYNNSEWMIPFYLGVELSPLVVYLYRAMYPAITATIYT